VCVVVEVDGIGSELGCSGLVEAVLLIVRRCDDGLMDCLSELKIMVWLGNIFLLFFGSLVEESSAWPERMLKKWV
jgi:hypothetical protein